LVDRLEALLAHQRREGGIDAPACSNPAPVSSSMRAAGGASILTDSSGAPAGGEFATNSAGHAQSQEMPLGTYMLREMPDSRVQPIPDGEVILDSKHVVVRVENTVAQSGGPYGSQ